MLETCDQSRLWSYREAAELLGLDERHGYRLVSELVDAWEIVPVEAVFPRRKCLTWADLKILGRALNRRLPRKPCRLSA